MRDDDLEGTLQAGSRAIAEAARPKSAESVRARGDQRRRRKAVGSALLIIAVVTGGGAAYAGVRSAQAPAPVTHPVHPSPRPSPHLTSPPISPKPHKSTGTTARLLPAGQAGTLAQVPWSKIGPGWSLAEYASGRPDPSGQWHGGGQMTLNLLDPAGGHYILFTQPDGATPWTLLGWAGDSRHALFGVSGEQGYLGYRELTLATGAITTFAAPAAVIPAGFTQPDGTNIVAVQRTGRTLALQRYSLTGTLQATLTSHVIGASQTAASNCGMECGAASSPDGTSVVWSDGGSLQLIGNAGGLLRNLPVPGTGRNEGCAPVRWWDTQTVLAACSEATGQRLWLVPSSGAAPTPLTSAAITSASDSGLVTGAWELSGTAYVNQTSNSSTCPQAAGGPTGASIERVGAGGSLAAVPVAGSSGTDNTVQGTVGRQLLVLSRTSCPGSNSLLLLNPVTGATQPLLTPSAGQAGVVAVAAFGSG
jgi:hypothetical protein